MKMLKFKRFITTASDPAGCLSSSELRYFLILELAGIKTKPAADRYSSFWFMRGPKEGMWIGLAAGLLLDVQCGDIIGFYGFDLSAGGSIEWPV